MLPLTFHSSIGHVADANTRKMILAEYAANGARHLVLTDEMIFEISRTPTLYNVLSRQVTEAGLDFVDSHAPYQECCNLAIPDERLRQYMIDRQRLALRIVHDFGVKTSTFHVGRLFYDDYTLEQYAAAVRKSLDALLPIAEDLHVIIAVENIMRPLNTTDFLLQLMAEYPSRSLGFCYDSGHANIMQTGRDIEGSQPYGNWKGWGDIHWETDVLDAMLPNIVTCHLHDNKGNYDDHMMPGKGTIPWKAVMEKLRQAPRLECFQSEVINTKHGYSIRSVCETMDAVVGEHC